MPRFINVFNKSCKAVLSIVLLFTKSLTSKVVDFTGSVISRIYCTLRLKKSAKILVSVNSFPSLLYIGFFKFKDSNPLTNLPSVILVANISSVVVNSKALLPATNSGLVTLVIRPEELSFDIKLNSPLGVTPGTFKPAFNSGTTTFISISGLLNVILVVTIFSVVVSSKVLLLATNSGLVTLVIRPEELSFDIKLNSPLGVTPGTFKPAFNSGTTTFISISACVVFVVIPDAILNAFIQFD